jgi:hypothetical protein
VLSPRRGGGRSCAAWADGPSGRGVFSRPSRAASSLQFCCLRVDLWPAVCHTDEIRPRSILFAGRISRSPRRSFSATASTSASHMPGTSGRYYKMCARVHTSLPLPCSEVYVNRSLLLLRCHPVKPGGETGGWVPLFLLLSLLGFCTAGPDRFGSLRISIWGCSATHIRTHQFRV